MNPRSKNRLSPDERKAQITAAALELTRDKGVYGWSWSDLALQVGVTRATLQYHFPSIVVIRRRVMKNAIELRDLDVLTEATRVGHPMAMKLPPDLGAAVTERLKGD